MRTGVSWEHIQPSTGGFLITLHRSVPKTSQGVHKDSQYGLPCGIPCDDRGFLGVYIFITFYWGVSQGVHKDSQQVLFIFFLAGVPCGTGISWEPLAVYFTVFYGSPLGPHVMTGVFWDPLDASNVVCMYNRSLSCMLPDPGYMRKLNEQNHYKYNTFRCESILLIILSVGKSVCQQVTLLVA